MSENTSVELMVMFPRNRKLNKASWSCILWYSRRRQAAVGSTNNCLILVYKVARIIEFRTNDAPITDRIMRGRHFGKIDDKLSATIVTNFVKTARKLYKTFSMAAVHKLW